MIVITGASDGLGLQLAKVYKDAGKPLADPDNWMNPEDIAIFMKQILDLPKSMEVFEIVINRKTAKT